MDPDRIKGKVNQVEGKIQDAYGDLAGSPKDDIKGKAKQVSGKIQEEWGKSKDAARRTMNRHA